MRTSTAPSSSTSTKSRNFKSENLVVLKNGKSYPATRPLREIQQKLEFR